jgi:ATP-binding cassette subfamily B protein RaxB
MTPILQAEASECGLACLAMVTSAYGNHVGLQGLREKFPVSLKGFTLEQLIDYAEILGFNTRPLRLDLEHLPQLQAPCILHWDMNHFVVLKHVSGGHVEIIDPAIRQRRLYASGEHVLKTC